MKIALKGFECAALAALPATSCRARNRRRRPSAVPSSSLIQSKGTFMRLSRLALLATAALLIAACSSGTGPTATPSAPAIASPSAAPSASVEATRIEVQLTDALRIEPPEMTVPAGVPVTFVVTNAGSIDHEFYLGDEDAQPGTSRR